MSEIAGLVKLSRLSLEGEESGAELSRLFVSTEALVCDIKNHEQKEKALFQLSA